VLKRYIEGRFQSGELRKYVFTEAVIFWGLIFICWIVYPTAHRFSIMTHTFSFLGSFVDEHNPQGWWIFSIAMLFWGLATVPLVRYIHRHLVTISAWGAAVGAGLFLLGCAGAVGVALFPDAPGKVVGDWRWTQIHEKAAVLVFAGFGLGIPWHGLMLVRARLSNAFPHFNYRTLIAPFALWFAVFGTAMYFLTKWEYVYADMKATAIEAGTPIGSSWSAALGTRYSFPLWENLVIYTLYAFLAWFALALPKAAADARRLADYMPIMRKRMAGRAYPCRYDEREITAPTVLCDAKGRVNPEAVGWSRRPLVRANLHGHRLRKKRWNFWNWIGPRCVFSVTLADIDYACFCAVTFLDFETKDYREAFALGCPGHVDMPEEVDRPVAFQGGSVDYALDIDRRDRRVRVRATDRRGRGIAADLVVNEPEGHESLNIVAPWSPTRFQCNAKHNGLPVEGTVTVEGCAPYNMDPKTHFAVQDWGRGVWPYRSHWNWGVCVGRQGNDVIGVNVGAKWTTGTGVNENAICINGRLQKIMEDLVWEYDPTDWMAPWRVRTVHTDTLDIGLTPCHANTPSLNLGLLRSGGVCVFGTWNGVAKFDGTVMRIDGVPGWAEEFAHRW